MKKKLLYIISIFYMHIVYNINNNINDNNPILTPEQFCSNSSKDDRLHFENYIKNIDSKYKEGCFYKDALKEVDSDKYKNYINKQVCIMNDMRCILAREGIFSYDLLKTCPTAEMTINTLLNELYRDIEKSYVEEQNDRSGTLGVYHTSHANMIKREILRDFLLTTLPYQISFDKNKEELRTKGDKLISIGENTVALLDTFLDSNGKILGKNGTLDQTLLSIKKMLVGEDNVSVKEALEKLIGEIEIILNRKTDTWDRLIDAKIDKFNNLFFDKAIDLLKLSVATCSAVYFVQKLYVFAVSYFLNNNDNDNGYKDTSKKKNKTKNTFFSHRRQSAVLASNFAFCVLSVVYAIHKSNDLMK
jgi:hypothetical protein